ncbi:hypothetical protein evm_015522, partial [Chilo suppressalis]
VRGGSTGAPPPAAPALVEEKRSPLQPQQQGRAQPQPEPPAPPAPKPAVVKPKNPKIPQKPVLGCTMELKLAAIGDEMK